MTILSCVDLTMEFGATRALDGVSLSIRGGEIHGLIGQNGSGKSTLIKILAGFHRPVSGRVWLNGDEMRLPVDSKERSSHRLAFVHQDLALLPQLSVAENFYSREIDRQANLSCIRWSRYRKKVEQALDRYGVPLDSQRLVRTLSAFERAQVAIVSATNSMRSREKGDDTRSRHGLLVLDEPTVFLSNEDAASLYKLMREIADQGNGVLFVSHDIGEVLRVADTLSVLRDGVIVGEGPVSKFDVPTVVNLIVGGIDFASSSGALEAPDVGGRDSDGRPRSGGEMLTYLSMKGLNSTSLHNVEFEARPGMIIGFTGLPGSGFDEVLAALYGDVAADGQLRIGESSYDLRVMSPSMARDAGIAYVPQDRAQHGCVASLSLTDNNTLPVLNRCTRGPTLSRAAMNVIAAKQVREYSVKIASPKNSYATMSGGNQQKAVLAKWLDTDPAVLLLSHPTQGVDIAARSEIWKVLRGRLRERVVLCASLDYDELIALCDEVIVFSQGSVAARLVDGGISKSSIALSASTPRHDSV